MSLGNCKLQQQDTIILLEWLRFKTENTKCRRMWSNRNTPLLLTGMQNGAAILEDNLAVSYTAKRILPYDRVIALIGIYSIELKTFVHQNMHMKACNSYILIIHPKLQETELSCHG